MSLILEALRKSEADRRRGQAPTLHAELPPAARTPKAYPAWSWLVLTVPLILLALWWAFRDRPATPVATGPSLPPSTMRREAADAQTLPDVPRLTPQATAPRASLPPPEAMADIAALRAAPAPTIAQPVIEASPDIPAAPPMPPPARTMPTAPPPPPIAAPSSSTSVYRLADLSIEERRSLPALKVSMHMWNDAAEQRFVIIDGTRLREGDRIGDAVIAAITVDGVELDWNGRRIALPIR